MSTILIIPNNMPFRYQVPPDEAVPILPADLVNMKSLETGKIDFANPDSVQKVADPFGYQAMNQNPNIGRRPNGVTNPSAYRPNSAPNINNIPVYGGKYRPFNSVPMGYGSTSSDLDFMAPTQEEIDRGLVPEVVTDPEEIKKMEEEEREAIGNMTNRNPDSFFLQLLNKLHISCKRFFCSLNCFFVRPYKRFPLWYKRCRSCVCS